MQIGLDQAREIIHATLAHGRENDFQKLAVAVLDARGALKAFAAEDGTSLKRGEVAMGKAAAALSLGVGTRTLNAQAAIRPHFLAAMAHVVGGSFVPVPGGVLIKDAAGVPVGAVGVSGDSSDNDEAAAVAGIESIGLVADGGAD